VPHDGYELTTGDHEVHIIKYQAVDRSFPVLAGAFHAVNLAKILHANQGFTGSLSRNPR
jgi:hypothetical protein